MVPPRAGTGPTDALVRRDTNADADDLCDDQTLYAVGDANFNTTALIDTDGTVQERYVYDPYPYMWGMRYVHARVRAA